MNELGTFSGHTPPALAENNPQLGNFLRVLDGMALEETRQVEEYEAGFDPRRTDQLKVLRRYVDEFEGEYRPDTPAAALECLYLHKGLIFGQKGTMKALKQWLTCITRAPRVAVSYEGPYPFLHFHTMDGGVLPSAQDIANEQNLGFKTPTLLADSWLLGYARLDVTIYGGYNQSAEFAAWLQAVLPRYLPMAEAQTTNVSVRFRPAPLAAEPEPLGPAEVGPLLPIFEPEP